MRFVGNYFIRFLLVNASFTILFAEYGKRHRKKNALVSDQTGRDIVRNNYFIADDVKKFKKIQKKALALKMKKAPKKSGLVYNIVGLEAEPQGFQQDAVMNAMSRPVARRLLKYIDYGSSSSSNEMQHWKEEWKDIWLTKKLEALNASLPKGDTVNMAAARPWGVPCGDPNQHDMPWGTCMLSMECEAEFRIYRGDFSCGRSTFICCALQLSTYDMYGGFDISFQETSLETDTEEKKLRVLNSREKRARERKRQKIKRKRERNKRKSKIKTNIQNIIKEIRKILDRAYRNGTTLRKKKTKELKKFIKELKKQYRKDRQSVKEIHEMEVIKVDADLMKKLNQIRLVNKHFEQNSTFRDIAINGTINKKQARMLMDAYPELEGFLRPLRSGRRAPPPPSLDYDVEYGYLYY